MKLTINLTPKPQARPRFTRSGRVYEDKEMTKYKKAIQQIYNEQVEDKTMLEGPLVAYMTFYMATPLSISKVKKNADKLKQELMTVSKKPDVDNLAKAILDALNGLAFKDDGQIAELHAYKRYSLEPRTEIEIYKLEE